jgi:lipid-binding SYLF domain-containing protein
MRLSHFCVFLAASAAMLRAQDETPDKRLRSATDTLREIMATPDKAIPRGLLNHGRCLVVVPGMKKAAFIVGGQYGRGFASCRSQWGWSAPSPVRLSGGSFGIQIGVDSTDFVLLVMNERGMNRLLSDKFSIGADAAVAAGPVGRDAAADTDILMRAEILSWSRTHGVFAGASLNGTLLEHDESEARKLYGRNMSNHEIITGDIKPPEAAAGFVAELNRIAPDPKGPVIR